MAIKALPNAKFLERSLWICFFAGLLLFGVVLAFVQQVRFTSLQTAADVVAHNKELQLDGANRYTQGQLDSINKVLTALVSSGGGTPDYKNTIEALLNTLPSREKARYKGASETGKLDQLSNADLAKKAMDEAAEMQQIEDDFQAETRTGSEVNAAFNRELGRWGRIRGECSILVSELKARLPQDFSSKEEGAAAVTNTILHSQELPGRSPLTVASDYIQELASQLLHQ